MPRWSPNFCFRLLFTPSSALLVFGINRLVKKINNGVWSCVRSRHALLRFPWVYHHDLVVPVGAWVFSFNICPYCFSQRVRAACHILESVGFSTSIRSDATLRSAWVASNGLWSGSNRLAARSTWARHRWWGIFPKWEATPATIDPFQSLTAPTGRCVPKSPESVIKSRWIAS